VCAVPRHVNAALAAVGCGSGGCCARNESTSPARRGAPRHAGEERAGGGGSWCAPPSSRMRPKRSFSRCENPGCPLRRGGGRHVSGGNPPLLMVSPLSHSLPLSYPHLLKPGLPGAQAGRALIFRRDLGRRYAVLRSVFLRTKPVGLRDVAVLVRDVEVSCSAGESLVSLGESLGESRFGARRDRRHRPSRRRARGADRATSSGTVASRERGLRSGGTEPDEVASCLADADSVGEHARVPRAPLREVARLLRARFHHHWIKMVLKHLQRLWTLGASAGAGARRRRCAPVRPRR